MLKKLAIGAGAFVIILALLFVTGIGQQGMFRAFAWFYGPDGSFNPDMAAPAPDYGEPSNWAALPETADPADLVPPGVETAVQRNAPVDVFFVHPTGYLSGASWTSPMDPNSAAEENTKWMMANQASAFNGCCNVYAPRYREATIHTYFQDEATREEILQFAYTDVERAFDYFLSHMNQGRPFVLASHSQGTHHLRRLLKARIDGTPLAERLVAVYAIGSVMIEWSPEYFSSMNDVTPCQEETDLGCVVHWDTFADGSDGIERKNGSLCTNPLTWRVDETRAPAELNVGAVPLNVPYNLDFSRENTPAGVAFTDLGTPIPAHTWAECRDGTLYVERQDGGPFERSAQGGNYHGLDYALFYMDIRENAIKRVNAFLGRG